MLFWSRVCDLHSLGRPSRHWRAKHALLWKRIATCTCKIGVSRQKPRYQVSLPGDLSQQASDSSLPVLQLMHWFAHCTPFALQVEILICIQIFLFYSISLKQNWIGQMISSSRFWPFCIYTVETCTVFLVLEWVVAWEYKCHSRKYRIASGYMFDVSPLMWGKISSMGGIRQNRWMKQLTTIQYTEASFVVSVPMVISSASCNHSTSMQILLPLLQPHQ